MKKKKLVKPHIFVNKLANEAIQAGLIEHCIKDGENYLIRQPGEIIDRKFSSVAAGVTLLRLLGRV